MTCVVSASPVRQSDPGAQLITDSKTEGWHLMCRFAHTFEDLTFSGIAIHIPRDPGSPSGGHTSDD